MSARFGADAAGRGGHGQFRTLTCGISCRSSRSLPPSSCSQIEQRIGVAAARSGAEQESIVRSRRPIAVAAARTLVDVVGCLSEREGESNGEES